MTRYACSNPACPPREPVTAEAVPTCYTCNGTMAAIVEYSTEQPRLQLGHVAIVGANPDHHCTWRPIRVHDQRRVCAMDGRTDIQENDLVRIVDQQHPIGRALHDAGPGDRLEIGGVDIITLEAPKSGDRHWTCRTVADRTNP